MASMPPEIPELPPQIPDLDDDDDEERDFEGATGTSFSDLEAWNNVHPNDLAKKVAATSDSGARDSLLSAYFRLERPVMTTSMLGFLKRPEACDQLLDYVSLRPADDVECEFDKQDGTVIITQKRPLASGDFNREAPDLDGGLLPESALTEDQRAAMQRSYKAMNLICTGYGDAAEFVKQRAGRIAIRALATFHPNSNGNLYHACTIVDHVLRRHADSVYKALSSNHRTLSYFLGGVLDYIHIPPVQDLLPTW